MSNDRFDVFSIGDASLDTYVQVPFIVGPDQKAMGDWLGVYGGGMAANFAAAAANAGATAAFMTVKGDDHAGRLLVEELREHDVDTTTVQTLHGSNTFQCFVQLDARGEKALFGATAGQKVPAVDDVPQAMLTRSDYVYALADDLQWAAAVGMRARAAGAQFALDLEHAAVRTSLEDAINVAAGADIVFTNTQAFTEVGLSDATEILDLLTRQGIPLVVVTDGVRGSIAQDRSSRIRVTGLDVPVRDTTGAGDAHNGALLGRISQGDSLLDSMVVATAMGALCVQHLGARGYRNAIEDNLPALVAAARRTATVIHEPPLTKD